MSNKKIIRVPNHMVQTMRQQLHVECISVNKIAANFHFDSEKDFEKAKEIFANLTKEERG